MRESILGIVPARLKSTRLDEKPLADICGVPMVVHVAKRAEMVARFDKVVVATDSSKIKSICESFGLNVAMTSEKPRNPSERMCELLQVYNHNYFVLVNGDEPLVRPQDITISIDTCLTNNADASLLSVRTQKFSSPSDFKIVKDRTGRLMYISRADIPHGKNAPPEDMEKAYHIMTFKRSTLELYQTLQRSYYESLEDHEHLRLIEYGSTIMVEPVALECFSVDTQEDLDWVRERMIDDPLFKQYAS